LAAKDRDRLTKARERYKDRRRRADERRVAENRRALVEFAGVLRQLLDEGYSMGDLGRELDMSPQAIYDLLRRARR